MASSMCIIILTEYRPPAPRAQAQICRRPSPPQKKNSLEHAWIVSEGFQNPRRLQKEQSLEHARIPSEGFQNAKRLCFQNKQASRMLDVSFHKDNDSLEDSCLIEGVIVSRKNYYFRACVDFSGCHILSWYHMFPFVINI